MALSICVAASANWPEYGMISPILTGCCACAGDTAKTASAAKTAGKCRFMGFPPPQGCARRNVDDEPVPPAGAAGRGVRIVHQKGEALRGLRRPRPSERGRDVLARTAEAVVHLLHGDRAVRPDVGAHELELGARSALFSCCHGTSMRERERERL